MERVPVRSLVHADTRQTHRPAGNLRVRDPDRWRLRNSVGQHHGRHRRGDSAADRAGVDLPEPHHFGPDRRCSERLGVSQANVLFITCHDLGQHLGCYGQSSVTSPALDRLAAGGVRLARSFCTAPQCSPSRASLHSGMYPHSAGTWVVTGNPASPRQLWTAWRLAGCVWRAASAPRRSAARVGRRCTAACTRTARAPGLLRAIQRHLASSGPPGGWRGASGAQLLHRAAVQPESGVAAQRHVPAQRGHLGCYGQSSVTSPALDRLAAGGVRLARSFCTAPQCSPSRASLHSGMYPHSAGVLGLAHPPYGWRLSPSIPHLAHTLGAHGYSTTLVGMQHLIDRGSAHELGYAHVLPVAPAYEEADAAVARLRELAHAERPFYLGVGFEEPHRPYDFGGAQPDTTRGVNIPGYLPDVPEARQDLAAFQGAIDRK